MSRFMKDAKAKHDISRGVLSKYLHEDPDKRMQLGVDKRGKASPR